ncbi:MAG TPA: hypothetical protein VNC50_07350, partial [Planctomycetia bacterium]|nr:hypothetical protein [Planctomycetia bacterium]
SFAFFRCCGGALVGFCGLLASVLALVSDSEEMLLLTGIVAPVALVPFAMGLWSLFRIRASHGQLTGLPLAYAGAAIFPILLFDVAVGILAFVTQFGLYALAILALLQMNVAVGWAGWRLVAQPYAPADGRD